MAPAALKSLEKYFFGFGRNLHPEDMNMQIESKAKRLIVLEKLLFICISSFQ